jgi:hypothetical protein
MLGSTYLQIYPQLRLKYEAGQNNLRRQFDLKMRQLNPVWAILVMRRP